MKLLNTSLTVIHKVAKCHKVSRYIRKCNLPPYQKHNLPWAHFHKINEDSTALCADFLHRISSNRKSKCGKYGHIQHIK